MRALRNHLAGQAAEGSVACLYQAQGARILAQRWRCAWGEIDLIVQEGEVLVFIEVKSARDHDRAAQRISPRQQGRLERAALAYVAQTRGALSAEMRGDVALVDGAGRVVVLSNALWG